jgi:hypothetical protein
VSDGLNPVDDGVQPLTPGVRRESRLLQGLAAAGMLVKGRDGQPIHLERPDAKADADVHIVTPMPGLLVGAQMPCEHTSAPLLGKRRYCPPATRIQMHYIPCQECLSNRPIGAILAGTTMYHITITDQVLVHS